MKHHVHTSIYAFNSLYNGVMCDEIYIYCSGKNNIIITQKAIFNIPFHKLAIYPHDYSFHLCNFPIFIS